MSAAEEQILCLLQQHNKPFNTQSIADWLAQYGIKKTQIQKALDSLVEAGKVTAKDFGKVKIYLPPQQNVQVLSKEDTDAIKAKISGLRDQVAAEKKAVRELEQELQEMSSSLTEEQLQNRNLELTAKVQVADRKLAGLKTGSVVVTKEDRAKVEKDLSKYMDAWRRNRGIFRNIWMAARQQRVG